MLKSHLFASCLVISAASMLLANAGANARTATEQVVCHGDSLTFGSNASTGQGTATGTTYPGVLAARLGNNWKVTSVGHPGWTLEGLKDDAKGNVDPLYDPKLSQNVLIIFGGTNNIGIYHQDSATVFAHLEEYCKAIKAAHPWKILVVTIPMAAYPKVYPQDFDSKAIQYDTLIRRNWKSFADGVIDVQADPRLGAPGDERDSRYFNAQDFTHLTDAGYQIVGEAAAKAAQQLAARH